MADNEAAASALLIDLDGVLYQDGGLIRGALETLDWIRRSRIPHLFVTNTSSRSRSALLDKFTRLGFSARLEEVMTPVVAANQWLLEHDMRRVALFVADSTRQDFDGVTAVSLEQDAAVDAVIVGDLGSGWSYELLNRAFRFLMQDPQPCLVALGMTRYWRGSDGLLLDVAPFIKALEHAASCEAIVVGKPAATFFDASLALLGCSAAQTLMIGDDIVGDVGAAQNCGIRGLLVRTGKFRDADLDAEVIPFAVLDSIADLPGWWRQEITGGV